MTNPVIAAIKRLLADQRVRYLIVGGFNTVFSLGIFTAVELLFGHALDQFGLIPLVISYSIAIPVAFLLHRKIVFQVKGGNAWLDFGRFVLTNGVGFGLNFVLLPITQIVTGLPPVIAQPLTQVFVVIVTYFMHKHFSFRRKTSDTSDAAVDSDKSPVNQAEPH